MPLNSGLLFHDAGGLHDLRLGRVSMPFNSGLLFHLPHLADRARYETVSMLSRSGWG
jgi:hypothetical protein